jgi:hypothetical protein
MFYKAAIDKWETQTPLLALQKKLTEAQLQLTNQKTRVQILKEKLLVKQIAAFDEEHTVKVLKAKTYITSQNTTAAGG